MFSITIGTFVCLYIAERVKGWFVLINSPGNINFDNIGLALSSVVHHALSVQHQNVSWLQTLGDIYLGKCFYLNCSLC